MFDRLYNIFIIVAFWVVEYSALMLVICLAGVAVILQPYFEHGGSRPTHPSSQQREVAFGFLDTEGAFVPLGLVKNKKQPVGDFIEFSTHISPKGKSMSGDQPSEESQGGYQGCRHCAYMFLILLFVAGFFIGQL